MNIVTLLVSWLMVAIVVIGDDLSFDYLMIAQSFPTAVCIVDNEHEPESCAAPVDASMWTVHGLWPSRTDGQIPQFCHTTGHKFDPTKLKSIEHELNVKWPNLLKGKGEYSLWKHEFEKHGSCAQQLPSLGDELLYFGKTLELHDQLMIATTLSNAGIIPSVDKSYSRETIVTAISNAQIGGHLPLVHCLHDTTNNRWLLADIRICLNNTFAPIDCNANANNKIGQMPSFDPCPVDDAIWYVPPPTNNNAIHKYYNWLMQLSPIGNIWMHTLQWNN